MSLTNLYTKKHNCFTFDDHWHKVMEHPEKNGAWLLWGREKMGKTAFAVMLAKYLAKQARVLYVSAEEGMSKNFIDTCRRAGLMPGQRGISFLEYEPINEIEQRLGKGRSPGVVIIDNLLIYNDELKGGVLRQLVHKHRGTLFIFLAHEDRNEPYTSSAKICRKLAKVIVHVEGLACHVSGRCPGGWLTIDEERAAIYHGHAINHPISTREAAV